MDSPFLYALRIGLEAHAAHAWHAAAMTVIMIVATTCSFFLRLVCNNRFTNCTNQLVDSMAVRGIVNSFASTVLYPGALHDYAFANFHATKSLVKHWETFQAVHPVGVVEYGDLPGSSLTAFPNPFRQTVTLHYSVGRAGWITLKIYDSLGREVWQVSSIRERGAWQVVWDGRDTVGREVPSGVYYGVLTAGAARHVVPLVLTR